MANMVKDDVTVNQLRTRNYQYAVHFAELVSMCVAEIVASSDDRDVRERAYQWRMWASPQARAAAFDQDPLVGLLELWVLSAQQRQYFVEGGGKDAFGNRQDCALETARELEEEGGRIISVVLAEGDKEAMYEAAFAWVAEHPIEGQLAVRPTARSDLARLVPEERQGGLKAVGSIEDTFTDLNDRITVLTAQMPVEARWQAEYLVNSLFEERIESPTRSMIDSVESMVDLLGELESVFSNQVNALLAGVEEARLAVFDAVTEERTAILTAVTSERSAMMDELDEQMLSASTELDRVGRGLVDHVFLRLVQVLVLVGVFKIGMTLLRKRRSGSDD
ncbi:MAG: hypothetical protein HKN10_18200 [Myxococcales bacterium]|nr:hypothetical protein [Myxococcales bacterium]